MSIRLYPHQAQFVEELRRAMHQTDSVLGQAATGFGKTVVGAHIAESAAAKGRRVIFSVHRSNLLDQTTATFREFAIPHGFIVAGAKYEDHHQVAVASVATLARRLERIPAPDLLVIDEAHLSMAATWAKVVNFYRERGSRVLGLSATPRRLDGRPLSDLFGVLVCGPSTRWLMDNHFLSEYRAFAPSQIDLTGIKVKMGDFDRAALEAAANKPALIGDAARHYARLAPGTRALAYCVSIRHSRDVAAHFTAEGIPAAHLDGTTPQAERERVIRAFADGAIQVLCNVDLITTGFDLSAQVGRDVPVETIIGLRPTASLALHLQMLGRGLRRKPSPAIFLDHAGNLARHGFPDDPRAWTLEGRPQHGKQAAPPAALVQHCPRCHALHRGAVCPECGYQHPPQPRRIEQAEGELTEIQRTEARLIARREQGQAATIDDLRALAARRGYRPGWAERVYHARQSRPPAGRTWRTN